MKHNLSILSIVYLCLLLAGASAAQSQAGPTAASASPASVPHVVKYSGTVKDQAGHPRSGVAGITFALYKDQQGGAPLWLETQNVQTDSKGNYTVLLGSSNSEGLPTDIFTSNDARWLGVRVEGQEEQPRTLLASAPYALKAGDAETLGGKPLSAFQLVAPRGQGKGSSAPSATSAAEQPNEIRCSGSAGCKTGFLPEFASNGGSATVSNSIVTQTGAGAAAKIGLGTASPGARLDVLGSDSSAPAAGAQVSTPTFPQYLLNATSGGPNAKIWRMIGRGTNDFEIQTLNDLYGGEVTAMQINRSGTSINSVDFPNGNVGIGTLNPGASLHAVMNTSFGTAILGENKVNNGAGAVTGLNSGNVDFASGVRGSARSTNGITYGVNGTNVSTDFLSAGVEGDSFATSGPTLGTVGTVASPNGTAVWGLALGRSNTGRGIGCCPVGVWGDTGSSAGGAAGLVGTADDGRAIYLENNSPSGVPTALMQQDAPNQFAVLAGGPGNFCTIDTNPAGAHLHCPGGTASIASVDAGQRQVALYGVESPQHWYEDFGSGHLAAGAASVILDGTFAQTVNASSDYHVFLTPEGDCRGLYVSKKTPAGFEVRELGGGQSNVPFGYRIVALRRGFEKVRLEDMTKRLAKANVPLPKAPSGARFTMPKRPLAPSVSAQSRVGTSPNRIVPQ